MQILVEMDSASKSVLSHVEYVVFDEADRLKMLQWLRCILFHCT